MINVFTANIQLMEMLEFKIYGEICKKCQIYCSKYLMYHVKEGARVRLGVAAAMQVTTMWRISTCLIHFP